MPYIGSIQEYEAGRRITVARALTLQEDLYMADHLFVRAPDVKPPELCLPVLPLSFALEAMAEVAACLAPGCGLIGFERVRTSQWTAVDPFRQTSRLHIVAEHTGADDTGGPHRIRVSGFSEGSPGPSMAADVIMDTRYPHPPQRHQHGRHLRTPYPRTVGEIYGQRHLFHGPSLRCLRDPVTIQGEELAGVLEVLPAGRLFASTEEPEMLVDPVVVDGIGQLLGLWAQAHGKFIFPVAIGKLKLFRPTPPAGTRVPGYVRIVSTEGKMITADMEVGDGSGRPWFAIEGWRDWMFDWSRRGYDFRRFPGRCLWSRDVRFDTAPSTLDCQIITRRDLTDVDVGVAAGYYVSEEEIPTLVALRHDEARLWSWLLGRMAAKECVRSWLRRNTGRTEMPHPAGFCVRNDENGAPRVQAIPRSEHTPYISIAHADELAVAAAADVPTGVDVERIKVWHSVTVDAIMSPSEKAWVNSRPRGERDHQLTRLWCAKEAIGKCRGNGLAGTLTTTRLLEDHSGERLLAEVSDGGEVYSVWTRELEGYIIACAMFSREGAGERGPPRMGPN
jgi:phosphopantetheinyl transferase